jgi:hypothetical protein
LKSAFRPAEGDTDIAVTFGKRTRGQHNTIDCCEDTTITDEEEEEGEEGGGWFHQGR